MKDIKNSDQLLNMLNLKWDKKGVGYIFKIVK